MPPAPSFCSCCRFLTPPFHPPLHPPSPCPLGHGGWVGSWPHPPVGGWGALPVPQLGVRAGARQVASVVLLLALSHDRWPLGEWPLGPCQASSLCGPGRGGPAWLSPAPPWSPEHGGGSRRVPAPPHLLSPPGGITLCGSANRRRLTWLHYTFRWIKDPRGPVAGGAPRGVGGCGAAPVWPCGTCPAERPLETCPEPVPSDLAKCPCALGWVGATAVTPQDAGVELAGGRVRQGRMCGGRSLGCSFLAEST